MIQNGIIINGVVYEAYETNNFRCENCELYNGTKCKIGADLCLELEIQMNAKNIQMRKLNSIE